jgi:predicted nucleic acid-binding protein
MTFYFCDTSALVKHYHYEKGSERVDAVFGEPGSIVIILDLAIVELTSALQRRKSRGEIDDGASSDALKRFATDTTSRLIVIGFRHDSIYQARDLVLEYGIRSLDALQLTSALTFKSLSPVFVCADRKLLAAAEAEGFSILNPVT